MTLRKRSRRSRLDEIVVVMQVCMMVLFPVVTAAPVLAQEPTQTYFGGELLEEFGVMDNSGLIPYDQAYFAFEVEGVLSTLKEVPLWYELEAMLDDPYAIALDPTVGGNPVELTVGAAKTIFDKAFGGDTGGLSQP